MADARVSSVASRSIRNMSGPSERVSVESFLAGTGNPDNVEARFFGN